MNVPLSQLPGRNRLLTDYVSNFEKVSRFYNGDFHSPDKFLKRASEIKERDLPLSKLVPILQEQNQGFGAGLPTLEKIDWLLERRACAVVTGQQTGLFGGPLFTLYKALTAIKLAARLSRTCEGCYVPVFWLASDDHDFREVNHVHVLDKNNQPVKIVYEAHSHDSKVPVAKVRLKDEIGGLIQKLDDLTHPSDFKQEVLSQLADSYAPGTTFPQAFGKWLMALLRPFGLILIDASDARVKALGRKLFEKEIADGSPSSRAAADASAALSSQGYHNQVHLSGDFLNLFYAENERESIAVNGDTFVLKSSGQTLSRSELLARVHAQPETFSPNVLLRPLYQDALLPTIAYVSGPSEGAYYAQMKGIYAAFDIPMPIIYPRKSLTLLESRIEKVLDHYQLAVPDFWDNVENLATQIAKASLPDGLETSFENTSATIAEKMQTLQDLVIQVDPTLGDFVKNSRGRILGQIDGIEKKVLQAYKKRNDVLRKQLYKASHSLYPNNQLQERQLNIVPYLFKHGFGFIDQLYEAMDISSFDHQIIQL